MDYRGYNPDREIMEKQLRAAYSEFLHVFETAMKEDALSQEDKNIVRDIENKMSELLKKLRNSNNNK